jgi:hypothetical protein
VRHEAIFEPVTHWNEADIYVPSSAISSSDSPDRAKTYPLRRKSRREADLPLASLETTAMPRCGSQCVVVIFTVPGNRHAGSRLQNRYDN